MSTVSTGSTRILYLLSLLQTHRFWAGGELADRLDVSVRTLRRDIERLRGLGYPVHASPGVDGGYQLGAGADLPPLLLDDEEAVALTVALGLATGASVVGIAESSVRALAKLTQLLPTRLRMRVEALRSATDTPTWDVSGARSPAADPETLVTLALACRDAERTRFDYSAADGTASTRWVEPLRLVPWGRRWYLVAYDLDRQDWRSFRIDRLFAPARTGERFRPRELPGGDAVAFLRAGLERAAPGWDIEAVVQASADRVRTSVGRWADVVEAGPECRLTMRVDGLEWAAFTLGMIGAPFRVVRPAELTGLLENWAARFTASAGPLSSR